MNNELINGDINSEWNYNNTHCIFNSMLNMSLNNNCSNNNNDSFMMNISLKKKYISNNVNILSKEYYANLNNKNSRKKKYFSKSSLTINTCNFNNSSINSSINNTLLQQHNNKCLLTHINKPKSYLNLKTATTTTTSANNNKSHLSTLTSLYSTTSNSFLNNNKHKHNNHLPKQHSYNHHHTLYKSNPSIQTSSPTVIKNPFATVYGSTKYQRQYIPSYSMKYHINIKNKTKSERNNCISSLRNKKLNAVYNNGYCILKRSERVKKNIIHTTIQHNKYYPLKNNNKNKSKTKLDKEEVEKLIDFIYDKNELYERMFKLGRYKMHNDILSKLNDNVVYRYGKFTKGKSQKEFMFK